MDPSYTFSNQIGVHRLLEPLDQHLYEVLVGKRYSISRNPTLTVKVAVSGNAIKSSNYICHRIWGGSIS